MDSRTTFPGGCKGQSAMSPDGLLHRIVVLGFATAVSVPAFGAPGDIIYSDDFERNSLAPWTTTDSSRSGVARGNSISSSRTRGGYTRNDTVTVTSEDIDLRVPAAALSVWVRRGSDSFSELPDSGEDFVIQYRAADFNWNTLMAIPGDGDAGEIFELEFDLPNDALHADFAVRFRQLTGSGFDYDYFHFDDVHDYRIRSHRRTRGWRLR